MAIVSLSILIALSSQFMAFTFSPLLPSIFNLSEDVGFVGGAGIIMDVKNGELWVASFGNHRALAFKLDASGNTAPLRTIRSGPVEEPALMIGNPGSVAYDSKREEILVPN